MTEIIAALSVCECCMLVHANGECCDGHEGPEPWSACAYGNVAMGTDEHSEHCEREADGCCDCDNLGFKWNSRCDGCGSYLGGERYAFVAFDN